MLSVTSATRVLVATTPVDLRGSFNRLLHLAVALAPRNRDRLETLLRDQQDPHSPSYHQYLSLEEFTSRFGPTEQDYQKARDFARANGLKVSGTYSNRIILDMEGAVPDVEKALHVTIRTYQAGRVAAVSLGCISSIGRDALHGLGISNARPYELPALARNAYPGALVSAYRERPGRRIGGAGPAKRFPD